MPSFTRPNTLGLASRNVWHLPLVAIVVVSPTAPLGCGGPDPGLERAAIESNEWLPGGATTNTFLLGTNAFINVAANATPEHELEFFAGNAFFNQAWVQAPASTTSRDGLGPIFNARSCSACHFKDGRGRPPVEPDALAPEEAFLGLLLRLSIGQAEDGAALPEPTYGFQLQPFAIAGVPAEGVPRVTYQPIEGNYEDGTAYTLLQPSYQLGELGYGPLHPDTLISPRVAPATIGNGLLEAISDARLLELADPEDADGDGISGRVNRVPDLTTEALALGRFGWKNEQPSVRQQVAGAFVGDIGITSDLFSLASCTAAQPECLEAESGGVPEISTTLLDRVATYNRLLAVPIREDWDTPVVLRGKLLFGDAGCAACHVPTHTTGQVEDLDELSAQRIWPYTDLLLHDMGEELSDERPVFEAEGNEWRTPPLWGIGRYEAVNDHERLLHDGRARGVAEAILWHGGEAKASQEAFRSMSLADRTALVSFVESL